MILIHLFDGSPIQIDRTMFVYIHDNFKLPNLDKIVYTHSVTNKIYCVIPFRVYNCFTFTPPTKDEKKDFSNLVPANYYLS